MSRVIKEGDVYMCHVNDSPFYILEIEYDQYYISWFGDLQSERDPHAIYTPLAFEDDTYLGCIDNPLIRLVVLC